MTANASRPGDTGLPPRAAGRFAADDADDRRLLERVCRHEIDAFEALYRRYHPRLARFLQRMIRPAHVVDEVLNDTLYVVWTLATRYDGSSKVSTWIFAIAYRKALKALHRHDEPQGDPAAEDAPPMAAPDDDRPEARLSAVQLRAALDGALAALSPDQRAAVELTYFHGMTYPEIAVVVDCPAETVKTRMFHARRRLKAQLAGRLEDWL